MEETSNTVVKFRRGYWNERTRAFWYEADGTPAPWMLLRVAIGVGFAECDACGQRHLVEECYVIHPARGEALIGNVCVNKVKKFEDEFGDLAKDVKAAHDVLIRQRNRARAQAMVLDPNLPPLLRNLIEALLWAKNLYGGNLALLKTVNRGLKELGELPVGPL